MESLASSRTVLALSCFSILLLVHPAQGQCVKCFGQYGNCAWGLDNGFTDCRYNGSGCYDAGLTCGLGDYGARRPQGRLAIVDIIRIDGTGAEGALRLEKNTGRMVEGFEGNLPRATAIATAFAGHPGLNTQYATWFETLGSGEGYVASTSARGDGCAVQSVSDGRAVTVSIIQLRAGGPLGTPQKAVLRPGQAFVTPIEIDGASHLISIQTWPIAVRPNGNDEVARLTNMARMQRGPSTNSVLTVRDWSR